MRGYNFLMVFRLVLGELGGNPNKREIKLFLGRGAWDFCMFFKQTKTFALDFNLLI